MKRGARSPRSRDALDQRLATAPSAMSTKVTRAPCAQKCSTMLSPMPRAAAGDEDDAVLQAGIDGVVSSFHRLLRASVRMPRDCRRRACRRGNRGRSRGRPAARGRRRASGSRRHRRRRRLSSAAPALAELVVARPRECSRAAGDVELDHVAVPHQRQRAADAPPPARRAARPCRRPCRSCARRRCAPCR